MAWRRNDHDGSASVPCLESLEERLLLTTIRGGEFFIYRNSQNETCRISLIGEPEDVVEVFADHAHFGVVDLPGFYDGNRGRDITWPVPNDVITRQGPNGPIWADRGDTYTDRDGYQVTVQYSSMAEIYAIYVVNCSPETRLTISKLAPADPARPFWQPPNTEVWYNRVDPWSGVALNLAGVGSYLYASNADPPVVINADGGGSILVGARHAPEDKERYQTRWVGVYGEIDVYGWGSGDGSEGYVEYHGVYPGTPPYAALPAGITISDEIFRMASADPIGPDVGAVAADAGGNVYSVDSSPFLGEIVNTNVRQGNIGNDIQAIAINQFGVSYVVDHDRQLITLSTGTDRAGNPIPVGADVRCLTAFNGEYYAIDESNGAFLQMRPGNREPLRSMGRVADALNPGQTFTNFVSLMTRPGVAGGELWGLATSSSDGQISLVKVAVPSNPRNTVDFTRVAAVNAADDSPWGPGVVPSISAATMRYDPILGLLIYGVTGGNQLVLINAGSGEVTLAGIERVTGTVNLTDFELKDIDAPANNNSLQPIVGLEFVGETLYGITQDRHLYRIDLSQLDTTSVICTDLGDSMAPYAQSLAYDPASPARFFTVMEQNNLLRLGVVTIEGSLVEVGSDGRSTVIAPLWDATQETFGFTEVTGLEYVFAQDPIDPTITQEFLYGLVNIADLDPIGLPAASAGAWLVTINETTGEVTRLGRIVGPTHLSSVAYNDLDGLFYAVAPNNNQLFVMDPGNPLDPLDMGDVDDRGTPDDLDDVIDLTGQTTVATGAGPSSVDSADINDDTFPDLVVANQTDGTVSVFLGDGAGAFTAMTAPDDVLTVGADPVFLDLADLTGDTFPDLIVVNRTDGTVSVLTGNGDGTFTAQADLTVGTAPSAAAVGLIDGDANADLVVSNESDSSVSVFLGNGDGTFAASGTVATAGQPTSVVLADANNDTFLDLVTSNGSNDTVSVLLGDGTGGFAPHQDYGPESVWVGLLDNDNDLDIVTANRNGDTVSVLLGDGSGGFGGRMTYAVGSEPVAVLLADIDRDGELDVITANQGGNDVTYCLGNGDGTFGAPTSVGVGASPRDIASGQLNGGNELDFVVVNGSDETVTVLLGTAGGGLVVGSTASVGPAPEAVAIGDMNDDGDLDIVVVNSSDDSVSFLLGNGDGTFQPEVTDAMGLRPSVTIQGLGWQRPVDVAMADVDQDGRLDVITANRAGDSVSVLYGAGTALSPPLIIMAGESPGSLDVGLIDDDNAPDIVVTNEVDDTASVLLNLGNGTFQAPTASTIYGMGAGPAGVLLADVDGDNNLDLITADRDDESVSVRLGQADGTFDPLLSYTLRNWFAVGEAPSSVAVADLDGDGNADIVTSNAGDGVVQSTVSILFGTGDGTYVSETTLYVGVDPQFVYIGDLNNDADWDIFTADAGSHTITTRLGNGDGTFGGILAYPVGLAPMSLAVIDLDLDGNPDLLSANSGDDTVSVLLGNGDGSFGGELVMTGNVDELGRPVPFVGIEWITAANGDQALFGVTASAEGTVPGGDIPGMFDPSESKLYTIDPVTGAASELYDEDQVVSLGSMGVPYHGILRYIPGREPHLASLTSLTYSPLHPGYLWSTDRIVSYYDSRGNLVDDWDVYIHDDGVPHLGNKDGPVLIERDEGYRLTRIRLSSALMVANEAGAVNVQTVLFDTDPNHPFWYYDDVYAMDYDSTGSLYAVGKLKSLVPLVNPLPSGLDAETWLVGIDDAVSPVPKVNVVTRVEGPLAVDEVTTISFGSGTLYGVSAEFSGYYLFTFDMDGLGNVTYIPDSPRVALSDDVEGMDFQVGFVSMLPGYGDGTFGLGPEYAAGMGPYLAPLADLNEDGYNDILTVNEYDDTISVILSETEEVLFVDEIGELIGFYPQVTYPTGDAPVAAWIAEFNQDGNLDVVTVNKGDGTDRGTVTVIFGAGGGTFQSAATPGQTWTGQLNDDDLDGDIDDDDYLDIVAANPDNDTVGVMMGAGDGTFLQKASFYAVGYHPQGLSVGQLNDDNFDGVIDNLDYVDVVTADMLDNTVSVLLGNGDGSFQPSTAYPVGYAPVDVPIGDLNGDGAPDLVVINNGETDATVLLNDGWGDFNRGQPADLGFWTYSPTDGALGDLNGDDRLDLVASMAFGTVVTLLGNGDGTFAGADAFFADYGVQAVALEQLNDDNGDGFVNSSDYLDAVTASYYYDTVSVLLGGGDGTLTVQPSIEVGPDPLWSYAPSSLYFGQLNDDNLDGDVDRFDIVDLVVANSDVFDDMYVDQPDSVSVLLGNADPTMAAQGIIVGDGTFTLATPPTVEVGDGPASVTLGDADGDGNLDVITGNYQDGTVSVLLGTGLGSFQEQFPTSEFPVGEIGDTYEVGYLPVDVAVGDLNRDLILDLVVVNSNANDEPGEDTVSVLIGNPDGTFQPAVPYDIGDRGTAVTLGNLNLDGSPDILVTNGDDDTLSVLLGNGDGTFAAQVTYDVGENPSDVAVGDVSGDGFLDAIVANYDSMDVSFLRGRPNGTFDPAHSYVVADPPQSVAVADLDGDENLDIVAVSEVGNNASVLMGAGNGVFLGYRAHSLAPGPRSVVLDDLNGDEVVDIVVANYDATLYGVSARRLYIVDPGTAVLTPVPDGVLSTDVDVARALSSNPLDSTFLWGSGTFGRGAAQFDYLISIFTSEENAIQDMGRIRVGGTVAGHITSSGNIEAIDIGWLWSDIQVGRNLDTLFIRAGGGGKIANNTIYQPYQSLGAPTPDIHVAGTLNRLGTQSGLFYGSVDVDNDSDVFPLGRTVNELEVRTDNLGSYHYSWIQGEFIYFAGQGVENDSIAHAQFINHPTGTMQVYGALYQYDGASTLPEDIPDFTGAAWLQDWYALPMQAGQTVTIQGWVPVLGVWEPFIYYGTIASRVTNVKAHMYDSDGRWVASLGYETWDDYGFGSRYRPDTAELIEEQKPMIFTAPAAGVYYLCVFTPPFPFNIGPYRLDIEGATPASLGGARVEGDWLGGTSMNAFVATDASGNEPQSWMDDPVSAVYDDIVVENGGHLGSVIVTGRLGGEQGGYAVPVNIHTIGGGDIYSVEGGTIGYSQSGGVTMIATSTISSEGSIGRIGTTAGDMIAVAVTAGFTPYEPYDPSDPNPEPAEPIKWDAYIQNVFTVGDVGDGCEFAATGSIGTMVVGGNMLATQIEVNSDEAGPPGRLDLIEVEGDWGRSVGTPVVPVLYRHDDGDIGYIHVGGTVIQDFGNYIGAATPHRKDNGEVSRLWDDGGGMLTITPSQKYDSTGAPMVDADGNPVYTSYSYITIGVDDFWFPGSGDGGVIVNLNVDGPATFSATGDVKIGDMRLDDEPTATVARNLNVGGSGKFSVYYLNGDQDWGNYNNTTGGDIISGMLVGINSIITGGSIGAQIGKLGTWIHGLPDAPVSVDLVTEPQYGWYRDKINGLMINGPVGGITAGGFIRDVRATGRIGPVVANEDRMTPAGEWHGINGIIWSAQRIDSVEVGDGLADDGPVAKCQAAIMSSYTIGKVTISGPRFVRDGVVFGEINGSILGYVNEVVTVTQTGQATGGASGDLNFPRNPAWIPGYAPQPTPTPVTTTVEWEALGSVIGTGGAHITAIVGGMGLDSFQCFDSDAVFYTGWQGANPTYSSVGKISFSGANAKIHGMEVAANYIGSVVVGSGTSGMFNTFISADAARVNGLSVGRVAAGGPGMKHVSVGADGGDVGVLEGLDNGSDMQYCDFVVTSGGIQKVKARDIIESTIHAPDDLGVLTVARDMLDVVSPDAVTSIQVRPGNGDGTFDSELEEVITSGVCGRDMALGDLNHDGWLDIVTANEFNDDHYVTVTLSSSYGYGYGMYYLPSVYYITEGGPRSVELADFDGDGNLDIVTGNYKDDTISVYFGDENGAFGDKRKYLVGDKPISVAVGDVNGDGVQDVITANEGGDNISVLLGLGNGAFSDQVKYRVGDSPSWVELGQVNDDVDAFPDIVVTNRLDDNVSVLLGNGDGTFAAQATHEVGEFPIQLALADVDNDGHLDIATANHNEHKVSLLRGDGAGGFTDSGKLRTGNSPRYVAIEDLDGDGNRDILVANQGDGNVSIFMSLGDPDPLNPDDALKDWFDQTDVLLEETEENPVVVLAALMDGDTVPDIVVLSRGELIPGLLVGAIGTFKVGHDLTDSYVKVAGPVGTLTVGNRFNNSTLLMPGAAANLSRLEVYDDISGRIESHGRIGTVVTRIGAIYADIMTTKDEDAPSNNVGVISTANGYFGRLEVAGSLGTFACYSSLGLDPREELIPQNFLIAGNLGTLKVVRRRGQPASNLYADISVGGTVKRVDVDGTLFGDLVVHGDLEKMYLDGNLGFVDADGTPYGSLDVLGTIKYMKFSKYGDLVADITSGGSIQKLYIRDGDLEGDIVSRYGDVLGIYVYNGNVNGSITGRSVNYVSVKAKYSNTGNLTGDITATNGNIKSIYVRGRKYNATTGNVLADISAHNGRVYKLTVSYGALGSAAEKYVVSATRGIERIDIRGDMFADVETEGVIDLLRVRGDMSDLGVSADSGITKLYVYGDMNNVLARTGGKIIATYVAGDMTGSILSAGWNIGKVSVGGSMTGGSRVLAGWDVGTDTISLLLGDGTGAVVPGSAVSAGDEPAAVALRDLNGDGAVDMVVANRESDDVSVRLSDGAGAFGAQQRYDVGDEPTAVAFGDVNGDGVVDILATSQADDSLSILLGNGDGTFADRETVGVGGAPQALAVGQLTDDNGDGFFNELDSLDVVTANAGDGTVSFLLNYANPGFDYTINLVMDVLTAGAEAPQAVAIGDVDAAGGPDLVAAVATDAGGSAAVLLGIGSPGGGFSIGTPDYYDVGANPQAVAIGDLNDDDVPDIAIADADDNNVAILFGGGDGTFGRAPGPVWAGQLNDDDLDGDIDGDDFLDIIVGNPDDDSIAVLLGAGDGTYRAAAQFFDVGDSPEAMSVGQFNDDNTDGVIDGDDYFDVVTVNVVDDTVSVLLGNGDGSFQAATAYSVAPDAEPVDVVIGDLDGDGASDLVVVNASGSGGGTSHATVMINDGNGAFTPQQGPEIDTGTAPLAAALGDVDHDGAGYLDLVVTNTNGEVLVLMGQGDGTFVPAVSDPLNPVGSSPAAVALVQLNDDNTDGTVDDLDYLDIVTADTDDGTVSVVLNNGDGTFDFANQLTYGVGLSPASLSVGLLNGDEFADVVVGNLDDDTVWVLLGVGDGTFNYAIPASVDVGAGPWSVTLGDADADGNLDLIAGNYLDRDISVVLGNGDGTFANRADYPAYLAVYVGVGDAPVDLAVGDMDGDRTDDLVVLNQDDETVSVLISNGNGTFQVQAPVGAGLAPRALALADVNADGDLDVVVAGAATVPNAMNGGNAHSGSIGSIYVRRNLVSSVVAAGIDPGDGDFLTLGDNTPAPGWSTIGKMTVRGAVADVADTAILADTWIYSRFVSSKLAGTTNVLYTTDFAPDAVETGDGNDFGPSVIVGGRRDYVWRSADGTFAIKLNGGRTGMAYYDEATRTLTLKRTTSSSSLLLKYTGAGSYGPVHIQGVGPDGLFGTADDGPATDDSRLKYLSISGNVVLGDVEIDGPVYKTSVKDIDAGAAWNLPGGVTYAKFYRDVPDLDVNAGYIRSWSMGGGYDGGTLKADAISGFYAKDDVAANVSTVLGGMGKFSVYGDYSGQSSIRSSVSKIYIKGSFRGDMTVVCGDLGYMYVLYDFSGVLDVTLGYASSIKIDRGDFGGQADTAVHTGRGISRFYVLHGDFSGLLNTEGNISKLYARRGEMTGKVRAAGSVGRAYFGPMTRATVAAGNHLYYIYIYGDMAASSIFAGLDLGYDPNGLPEYNVELDGVTPALWRTAGNADTPRGGSIRSVVIYGNMSPEYDEARDTWDPFGRGSTIAASVAPGNDGYVGTYDDEVRGAGTIGRVTVYGNIIGNGNIYQSYGIFAASAKPTVYFQRKRPFEQNDNAYVGSIEPTVGNLYVEDARTESDDSLVVRFNHTVNMGTLNTRQREPNQPTTFLVYGSSWGFVDLDGDGWYDADAWGTPLSELSSVSDTEANIITWDAANYTATLKLTERGVSWRDLPNGPWFLLVLDGDRVADPRGTLLDGDRDGAPGGDFQYLFYRS